MPLFTGFLLSIAVRLLLGQPVAPVGTVERRVVAPKESLLVQTVGPVPGVGQPAVLLIPGPVGSLHSMRLLASRLASKGHPVRVVDPLGMGASSSPAGADYSLGQQAVRLLQIMRSELPGTPVVVAAIGTSATIAMHMAATAPDEIVGVASIAGGPMDQQSTKMMKLALAVAPLLDNRLGRGIARRRFVSSMKTQSASTAWMTDSVVLAYTAPLERDLSGVFRSLRFMAGATERVPIATRLPAISSPLRLLLGDTPTPSSPTPTQIAMLQTSVRDFAVDTIRAAGTMLHEEQPHAVVAVIEDLVRRSRQRKKAAIPAQLELPFE